MEKSVRKISYLAVRLLFLLFILVLLSFIPYTGYNPAGYGQITLLLIPVLAAGVAFGPLGGGCMGILWAGFFCVREAFGAASSVTPGALLRFIPSVMSGTAVGFICSALKKTLLRSVFRSAVSAGIGALIFAVLSFSVCRLIPAAGQKVSGGSFWSARLAELAAAVIAVPALLWLIRRRGATIGIDMGGSSTKLALIKNGKFVSAFHIEKGEDIAEAVSRIGTAGISRIALTGVGAASVSGDIAGIPTYRVEEFRALANGSAFCSGRQNFLCVSIGTGTSFVRVTPFAFRHFGGTGMGGGTLHSLSALLCGTADTEEFQRLAGLGDLSHIDLQLKDICDGEVPGLLPTTTVSNLGKKNREASKEDMAAGICNLVFESIGVMAAFCVKSFLTRTVVMTGAITEWQIAERSLDEVASLHHVRFIVPEHSRYAGAIGAALTE